MSYYIFHTSHLNVQDPELPGSIQGNTVTRAPRHRVILVCGFLLYRLCRIKFPCDALMRMYSTSNKMSMKSSRVMGRPSAYFHAFCKKSKIGTLKKIFFQKNK